MVVVYTLFHLMQEDYIFRNVLWKIYYLHCVLTTFLKNNHNANHIMCLVSCQNTAKQNNPYKLNPRGRFYVATTK